MTLGRLPTVRTTLELHPRSEKPSTESDLHTPVRAPRESPTLDVSAHFQSIVIAMRTMLRASFLELTAMHSDARTCKNVSWSNSPSSPSGIPAVRKSASAMPRKGHSKDRGSMMRLGGISWISGSSDRGQARCDSSGQITWVHGKPYTPSRAE
jgi:hypothetical protein